VIFDDGYSPTEDTMMIIFYDHLSTDLEALYTREHVGAVWASSTYDIYRNQFIPHRMNGVDYYRPYGNYQYSDVMDILLCSVQVSPNLVAY
jgi:hypothetical protein